MNSFVFRSIFLSLLVFSTVLLAQAQATRTYVSGVGDDANPCSRTAPCKTFAGTITKTAPGGEINCLDPGGFGTVTINRPITIDCTGTYGSILVTTGNAITINFNTGGFVRIRGLSITGQGQGVNGIVITQASRVNIEDSIIDGFTGSGIIMQNAAAGQLCVDDTTIRNNGFYGINIFPVNTLASTSTTGSISNSRIIGHNNTGIITQTSDFAVSNCIISGNVTGISTSTNGFVRISGNTISENFTGISAGSKGSIISYGNNAIGGNSTANGAPTSTVPLQ